jgi:ribosomal-protein-alanine N-acetyltransferase
MVPAMDGGATSLRPATEEDIPQLLEVERHVHVAPWTADNFKGEMGKPYSQVLLLTDDETDSKVIGYIVFWLMFDECQILNVAVDLPYRGLGHAKKMIRRVIDLALKKDIKRAILEVRKTNLPAVQLYQSLGFGITQIKKGFYSNGEDAYQMSLDLSGPRLEF